MLEKIIEIVSSRYDTELKANQIIILFNQSIIDALKEMKDNDIETLVNKIFIPI
jgi:hypothetical protein